MNIAFRTHGVDFRFSERKIAGVSKYLYCTLTFFVNFETSWFLFFFEGIRTACRAVDLLFTQRLRHSKGARPCLGIELVLDTTSTNQVGVEDFL